MSSSIDLLNHAFREYFSTRPSLAIRQSRWMESYLLENNCTFKGTAMPTLLKPNFISARQRNLLKRCVEKMSHALVKFISLYLRDGNVAGLMGFTGKEDKLFRIDPGYKNPLVISRLDAFLNNYDLKFLEFNCDSPAGIAYSDIQEAGFRELLDSYPFMTAYHVDYMSRQQLLMDSFLTCYNEFRQTHRGMPERPVLAIVDWKEVSTYSEFQLHQDFFRERGIETVIAEPQDFSISGGKALANGQEVHLIYKRVITRELLTRWEEVQGFIHAVKDGLACCCNSFRSFIVGNKKVLAVITDPRFSSIFTPGELELIHSTVPWTAILTGGKTLFKKKEVNLKDFVPEHKDDLVMKPSNKYGGKDVYIGRETDQQKWEEIMREHIGREDWVVQEYVNIPTDLFPEISGTVRFKSKYVNINPYALNGIYSGTITRVSDNQVINVSAGGGLVPTLTVQ